MTSYHDGNIIETYGYDALGNRISKDVNGVRKADYRYNALNQMTERVEDGIQHSYRYDRRGNLKEEKCGDSLVRQYLYDATGCMTLGKNLENGEKTEYTYNALYQRVKNIQTRQNHKGNYPEPAKAETELYVKRETDYVIDFLSDTHNELMTYEKGNGCIRTVYGPQYQRLSRRVTTGAETQTPGAVIAGTGIGKAYFQSDLYGSPRFACNETGDVLQYAERNVWGSLKLPMQEDANVAGLKDGMRFTTYDYDPVIGKFYAQARFYDAGSGRMLGTDPVKRGLNGYPYCQNDPVDYVDPTGEILNILASAGLGALIGGGAGFVGSAISQKLSGQKVDWRKALGSAMDGAITGGTKAALYGSGGG